MVGGAAGEVTREAEVVKLGIRRLTWDMKFRPYCPFLSFRLNVLPRARFVLNVAPRFPPTFRVFLLKQEPRSKQAIVRVCSSGTGESSNSLNDRTAVRIDAAIQAALAIAGTSSNFDVPRPTGRFNAAGGGGGGGGGGLNVTNYADLAIRFVGGSGDLPGSGSETSAKSAVEVRESKKATTEARLDAAIQAALVIHATNRTGSSSSSTLQGSTKGGDGASLELAAPRGDEGGGAMLTVYRPPAAPPRVRGHHSASRELVGGGYYGGASGGSSGAGRMPLNDTSPASGRERKSRSRIGISAGVNKAVQALASAQIAQAHQATAAKSRLQRLKEEQKSRRRRQHEQGSSGEMPYRPRESEAPALERRKDYSRRIADATARGQARAQAEKRARAETLARERVSQDEKALVEPYPGPPAAAKVGQRANYGSGDVGNHSRSAAQGPTGRNAAFVPPVAGDGFLPETSLGGARRARVGAGRPQRQPWRDGDSQKAYSGALAQWDW